MDNDEWTMARRVDDMGLPMRLVRARTHLPPIVRLAGNAITIAPMTGNQAANNYYL